MKQVCVQGDRDRIALVEVAGWDGGWGADWEKAQCFPVWGTWKVTSGHRKEGLGKSSKFSRTISNTRSKGQLRDPHSCDA